MLTPKDLENPTRKSGYDYVSIAGSAGPNGGGSGRPRWFTQVGRSKGRKFLGPRRPTAEEAAQDYCDYVNGQPALTIEDIRNPKRKSGFDHVSLSSSKSGPGKYFAYSHNGSASRALGRPGFYGPRRDTGEEAARDYCDYINGQRLKVRVLSSYDSPVIDMGNTTVHAPKSEKISISRKRFVGPHDLYDVVFTAPLTGEIVVRKTGITAAGYKRYEDICRMLGMSIKPLADAVTYPSYEAARDAEDARIAVIDSDPQWKRVGKESFAPVHGGSNV